MPFVNFRALSPEQVVHLSDQWHAASREWDQMPHGSEEEELSEEEHAVLVRLHKLSQQLRGKEQDS